MTRGQGKRAGTTCGQGPRRSRHQNWCPCCEDRVNASDAEGRVNMGSAGSVAMCCEGSATSAAEAIPIKYCDSGVATVHCDGSIIHSSALSPCPPHLVVVPSSALPPLGLTIYMRLMAPQQGARAPCQHAISIASMDCCQLLMSDRTSAPSVDTIEDSFYFLRVWRLITLSSR